MNQTPIKLGPLTLLLTIISICLTVLAILTFTTAQADERLAQKYAQTVQVRYELEQEGQAFYRDLSEYGADMIMDDTVTRNAQGIFTKTFEKDGATLRIGYRNTRGDIEIVSWRQEKEWEEDTDLNLWDGF